MKMATWFFPGNFSLNSKYPPILISTILPATVKIGNTTEVFKVANARIKNKKEQVRYPYRKAC